MQQRTGPGRLAEHGDIRGISPEGRHIVSDPLQSGELIPQATVGLGTLVVEPQEAHRSQSVVHRHHHDIVVGGQRGPVVGDQGASASEVSATVNPDHDREVFTRGRRAPNVNGQAVLGNRSHQVARDHAAEGVVGRLHRRGSRLGGLPDPGPRLRGLGGLETQGAKGRRGVGDPAKSTDGPPGLFRLFSAATHRASGRDHVSLVGHGVPSLHLDGASC